MHVAQCMPSQSRTFVYVFVSPCGPILRSHRPSFSPSPQQAYAIVKRFEFSAALQRNLVVVRAPDNSVAVFAKGSPEAIRGLVAPSSVPPEFDALLGELTREGLRVLALAAGDASLVPETQLLHWTQVGQQANLAWGPEGWRGLFWLPGGHSALGCGGLGSGDGFGVVCGAACVCCTPCMPGALGRRADTGGRQNGHGLWGWRHTQRSAELLRAPCRWRLCVSQAETELHVELRLVGLAVMANPLRPDTADVISKLQHATIRTVMVGCPGCGAGAQNV